MGRHCGAVVCQLPHSEKVRVSILALGAVWTLHIQFVSDWVFFRFSDSLLQSKSMQMKLVGRAGESVTVKSCFLSS